VASDPVVTDILKTVHTQYAAFILNALQMNQLVTRDKNVQDLLKVVATEAYQSHESVLEGLFGDVKKTIDKTTDKITHPGGPSRPGPDDHDQTVKTYGNSSKGEIQSFAGDNHIPAGKIIEITLTNPENPKANVTLNLLVQLSPYIVPAPIAVQFITKDMMPSFTQRVMQWKTGEISFWRDFILMSDIVNNRAKLMKLDPSGVLANHIAGQNASRQKAMGNLLSNKADRARNIANSVLIFNAETVQRAKAEVGIDLSDDGAREKYFAITFAMIIVVVDPLYNQVTLYYNGISDAATFSFDQMRVITKGGNQLDLIAVMNALSQGKSPKF